MNYRFNPYCLGYTLLRRLGIDLEKHINAFQSLLSWIYFTKFNSNEIALYFHLCFNPYCLGYTLLRDLWLRRALQREKFQSLLSWIYFTK